MAKRFLLMLTDAELAALRRRMPLVGEAVERRVVSKLVRARELPLDQDDFKAYDRAASEILDSGEWSTYARERDIKGNPYRARNAIAKAVK